MELVAAKSRVDTDHARATLRGVSDGIFEINKDGGPLAVDLTVLTDAVIGLKLTPKFRPHDLPPLITDILTKIDDWQAYVGAEFAAAWGYIVLYDRRQLDRLDRIASGLLSLAQALRDVSSAVLAGEEDRALAATKDIRNARDLITDETQLMLASLAKVLPTH